MWTGFQSLSGEGTEELIGVPLLPGGGTGENQASAVVTTLEEWSISERVIGMYFNMIASNTWRQSVACIHTEQMLGWELFCFACCYHILELVLSGDQ